MKEHHGGPFPRHYTVGAGAVPSKMLLSKKSKSPDPSGDFKVRCGLQYVLLARFNQFAKFLRKVQGRP
jgi:hypothetical protein